LTAVDPATVKMIEKETPAPETLSEIIEDRCQYLTAYQNQALADRYRSQVEDMLDQFGEDIGFVVARNYFKVLAYKDEYEVARLYSDKRFREALEEEFVGDYKLSIHLAPPLLAPIDQHSGLPRKLTFGRWIFPVFSVLAKFKFLRGKALDPFSYTADRKLERSIIADYESLMLKLASKPEASPDIIKALLSLPEKIRGFGYIKERNFKTVQVEREQLLAGLYAQPEPIKMFDPEAA
jgi:indolepyruvate ferredoxin oxidoreductase